jgi:adenylosuccinate lyase
MKHSSILLQNTYGTPEMREVWSEENMIQKWLDVERAITEAQKELKVIPANEADEIIKKCSTQYLSAKMIADFKVNSRHLIVSFIQAFEQMSGSPGENFHLGATTQDILDTGSILQIRESLNVIVKQLYKLEDLFAVLANEHKETIMMGRTHGQHAMPLTFGLKMAIWASEISEHIDRLAECSKRLFRLRISGGVGTNASYVFLFGQKGFEDFQVLLSKKLGLEISHIDLHQRIDQFVEMINNLALIGSTLGKIGLEIRDLQQTEIAEVKEKWEPGKFFSSSTMPHKRNPALSEAQDSLAQMLKANASAFNNVRMQYERDATWITLQLYLIEECFLICSRSIENAQQIFNGLEVCSDRMLENFTIQNGLAMSETIMLALYKKTKKKQTAYRILYQISNTVWKQKRPIMEVLLDNEEVAKYFTKIEIRDLLDPKNYCGNAAFQIEKTVGELKKKRKTNQEIFKSANG